MDTYLTDIMATREGDPIQQIPYKEVKPVSQVATLSTSGFHSSNLESSVPNSSKAFKRILTFHPGSPKYSKSRARVTFLRIVGASSEKTTNSQKCNEDLSRNGDQSRLSVKHHISSTVLFLNEAKTPLITEQSKRLKTPTRTKPKQIAPLVPDEGIACPFSGKKEDNKNGRPIESLQSNIPTSMEDIGVPFDEPVVPILKRNGVALNVCLSNKKKNSCLVNFPGGSSPKLGGGVIPSYYFNFAEMKRRPIPESGTFPIRPNKRLPLGEGDCSQNLSICGGSPNPGSPISSRSHTSPNICTTVICKPSITQELKLKLCQDESHDLLKSYNPSKGNASFAGIQRRVMSVNKNRSNVSVSGPIKSKKGLKL